MKVSNKKISYDSDIADELSDYVIFMTKPHSNMERKNITKVTIRRLKAIIIQSLLENGSQIDPNSILEIGNPDDL